MGSEKRVRTVYVCQSCGQSCAKWLGRCPGCGAWHTLVEERHRKADGRAGERPPFLGAFEPPRPLLDVPADIEGRTTSGLVDMDRVLGGGIVAGAVILLGGEPGIGKSTLLLQVLMRLANHGSKVLYISGEESAAQIRLRAERLGEIPPELWVASEGDPEIISRLVGEQGPEILAVDSIQTLSVSELGAAPGSVTQVREATARLVQLAKGRGLPVLLVGHVTKEGEIAGPRVLEHMVDTVLYFEGDRSHSFRLLRTVKNRYGPTHEIGVFEMTEAGLREVANPSEALLGQRGMAVSGAVVVPCVEGSRPILVEIQALVTPTHLTMPRRTCTGVDSNRLALLVAVAEKHLGVAFYDRDIFVNVVGGLRVTEPAADLAVLAALISSLRDEALDVGTAVFGEVGLTGEIRPVGRAELRLAEVARLGLTRCLLPAACVDQGRSPVGLEVVPVRRLEEAVETLFKIS